MASQLLKRFIKVASISPTEHVPGPAWILNNALDETYQLAKFIFTQSKVCLRSIPDFWLP